MMEDLFMVLVLIATAAVTYRWSFTVLWFKVGSLFDLGAESSSKQEEALPKLEIDESTFLCKLYSEYSVPSFKVLEAMRVLFSSAMIIYIITIEIILWQIKTADVQQTADFVTRCVWPLVSILLSALLILVQPFFIVMSLLNKFFEEKFDIDRLIIISCGVVTLFITTLNYIALGPFNHAESMLTRLSIAGVTIMANLAGIASVSTLYSTFWAIRRRYSSKPSYQGKQRFTGSLLWISDRSLEEQIELYQREVEENIETLRTISRYPDESRSVTKEQIIEVIGWYRMEITRLEKSVHLPPLMKFIKKACNVTFLLYCVHKIISVFTRTIPRLFSREDTEWVADPLAISIANIMDLLIFRFQHQYEVDSLTKQVSLILSISLFICSLSTVATTISFLIALLPDRIRVLAMYAMQGSSNFEELPTYNKRQGKRSSEKSPSIIKNLIVSELAGIYVVATVLSIRSNLPFDVSEKVNELLGERFTVANVVIDKWFELIYAISCISTFVCIKLAERTTTLPHSWTRSDTHERDL